jgi:hypothetical protein
MTDELLKEFDIISIRPDWIPGCFLLLKNTPNLKTLFQHSKDYKKVFTSQKHCCFDETNFAHSAFEKEKYYQDIQTEINSMIHVVKKMEEEQYIKPYFDSGMIEGGCPGQLKMGKRKIDL